MDINNQHMWKKEWSKARREMKIGFTIREGRSDHQIEQKATEEAIFLGDFIPVMTITVFVNLFEYIE